MAKWYVTLMIIAITSFSSDQFIVKHRTEKKHSIKVLQEDICDKRIELMRIIVDLQGKLSEVQRKLQEDFFAFASGDKKTVLSSKDRELLEKEVGIIENCHDALQNAFLVSNCF